MNKSERKKNQHGQQKQRDDYVHMARSMAKIQLAEVVLEALL